MDDVTVRSPDGRHEARLLYAGRVRFGPPYCSLETDGRSLGRRVVGAGCLWSQDAPILAVEEWLMTEPARGPRAALVLLDAERLHETNLSPAAAGFVVPLRFEGPLVVCKREDYGRGVVREIESGFPPAPKWRPIGRTAW